MSIVVKREDTLHSLRKAKNDLVGNVLGGLGLALIVLVLPKDYSWSVLRLGLAVCFFTGIATVLWGLTAPLEAYLKAFLELRFEDFGAETRKLGHAGIDAFCRYMNGPIWLLLAITGLLFLLVLAAWPVGAPLLPLVPCVRWSLWIVLAAFPLQLFFSTNRLTEVVALWRIFKRNVEQSGYQPLTLAEAETREARFNSLPGTVTRPYHFEAGGIEWSWWDDFRKSVIVFGQIGSGKTVTVLNALLDGLLSSADGRPQTEAASALILDPKGDYLKSDKLRRLCARIRRLDDLCMLDPDHPDTSVHWNPFDSPDDAGEISERFAGVLELLGMKNTQDTFWIGTAKVFMRNAIVLLRATEPPDSPPSFAGINDLATKATFLEARLFILYTKALLAAMGNTDIRPKDLVLDSQLFPLIAQAREDTTNGATLERYFRYWAKHKKSSSLEAIHDEVIRLSDELQSAPATPLRAGSDALLAAEYFLFDWMSMPEKTRGSVQAQLTLMISPFLAEPYRTIFSGKSTRSLSDVVDDGKIFYVYMPSSGGRSEMSVVVNTLIKLEFYRQVLMRPRKSRPSLFFCDEFQAFFTADERRGDTAFFAQSRESFHANVIATQNLAGLLMNASKVEAVDSLLGNCAVKIFLRNTEGKTNEYASKNVFGEYLGSVVSVGRGVGDHGGLAGLGQSANFSESTQTLRRVPAERFIELAIPSEGDGVDFAEAFVALGSRARFAVERLRFKVHPLVK